MALRPIHFCLGERALVEVCPAKRARPQATPHVGDQERKSRALGRETSPQKQREYPGCRDVHSLLDRRDAIKKLLSSACFPLCLCTEGWGPGHYCNTNSMRQIFSRYQLPQLQGSYRSCDNSLQLRLCCTHCLLYRRHLLPIKTPNGPKHALLPGSSAERMKPSYDSLYAWQR